MGKRTFVLLAVAAGVALSATAELTGVTHAQTGTILITLGTRAGPLPDAKRMQSSDLLVVNGTPYLIDAGGGVTHRLAQSGYDFRKINKIFITHAHDDHTAGLVTLLGAAWDYKPAKPIDVFGSGADALVKGAVGFLTPNADIRITEGRTWTLTDSFRAHEIKAGVVYQDENLKVTAVENTHFNFPSGTAAYGKYKSYSYRFDTPDRVVFYTGDTGPNDAVAELAKGADLLLTETSSPDDVIDVFKRNGSWQRLSQAQQEGFLRHMHQEHVTPTDVGQMATKAGVKAVVMTHLTPSTNPDDDYQRYVTEAKKYYSGPITIAKDLMKF